MQEIHPIDGIKDHYTASTWLLDQMRTLSAFFSRGQFYLWEDTHYSVYKHSDLQLLIINVLKEKASPTSIKMVIDRLEIELAAESDIDNDLLAFRNGVLHVNGQFSLDATMAKEARITSVMPYDYDQLDNCDHWLKFLDEVFAGDGDIEEKKTFLQEYFGYVISRATNYHKALVLYGDGGNGKSVILDVMAALVPNVSHLEWSEFGEQRGLERIAESWLNVSSEINYKETSATTGIKKAIAQEVMTGNPKYKKPFDFTCKAKLCFATNGLPMVDDSSNGVFRRLIVLTLNNSFIGKEDWALTGKLLEEIPGVFNWALRGLKRLKEQNKFTDVPSNIIELQEYRRSINSLQSYYDENLCMMKGEETTFDQFYNAYHLFCSDSGNRPYARNKIRSLIRQLGLRLNVYTTSRNVRMIVAVESVNYC